MLDTDKFSCDFDIFFFGLTPEEASLKLKSILQILKAEQRSRKEKNFQVISSRHAITVICGKVKIQFILRLYKSVLEILTGFDVDSCCVAYDGKRVLTIPRFLRAEACRYNLIDPSRASINYEDRLWKYSERGFGVAVPGFDKDFFEAVKKNGKDLKLCGLGRLMYFECGSLPDEFKGLSDYANGTGEVELEKLMHTSLSWVTENPGRSFHPQPASLWDLDKQRIHLFKENSRNYEDMDLVSLLKAASSSYKSLQDVEKIFYDLKDLGKYQEPEKSCFHEGWSKAGEEAREKFRVYQKCRTKVLLNRAEGITDAMLEERKQARDQAKEATEKSIELIKEDLLIGRVEPSLDAELLVCEKLRMFEQLVENFARLKKSVASQVKEAENSENGSPKTLKSSEEKLKRITNEDPDMKDVKTLKLFHSAYATFTTCQKELSETIAQTQNVLSPLEMKSEDWETGQARVQNVSAKLESAKTQLQKCTIDFLRDLDDRLL